MMLTYSKYSDTNGVIKILRINQFIFRKGSCSTSPVFIGGATVRWVGGAGVVETATRRKMKRRPRRRGGQEGIISKGSRGDQEDKKDEDEKATRRRGGQEGLGGHEGQR